MPVSNTMIIDVILLAIFIFSVVWGGRRGVAVFFSGIAGTVIAAAMAFFLSPFLQDFFTGVVKPFARGAVTKAAEGLGLDQTLTLPVSEAKGQFLILLEKLGISDGRQAELFEKASQAGEKVMDSISSDIARQLAPILAFIALFLFIKLVVFVIIRFMAQSVPVLKSVNKLAGYLLGTVSGLVIVFVLCWAGATQAPEDGSGLITRQNVQNSLIGSTLLSPFNLGQAEMPEGGAEPSAP